MSTSPQLSSIVTSSNVTWANGSLFNGWLLLGVAMPTGATSSSYPTAVLWGNSPPQSLPQWTMIPIVQGALDNNTTVFQTTYLDPPGCQYVAYWLDNNKNQIYPAANITPTLFTITSGTYTIAVPSLTTPTTPNVIPAPQSASSVSTSTSSVTYAFPSYETPVGTVDGSNAVFTVSRVPNVLMFLIDGQVQAPSAYTLAGQTVTLNTAPVSGSTLTAVVF